MQYRIQIDEKGFYVTAWTGKVMSRQKQLLFLNY